MGNRNKILSTLVLAVALVFTTPNVVPNSGIVEVETSTKKISQKTAVMYPTETLQLKVNGAKTGVTSLDMKAGEEANIENYAEDQEYLEIPVSRSPARRS